jgi:hypothetical protein
MRLNFVHSNLDSFIRSHHLLLPGKGNGLGGGFEISIYPISISKSIAANEVTPRFTPAAPTLIGLVICIIITLVDYFIKYKMEWWARL